MVVKPTFPAKTVPEFIAYAKANPGKINMTSTGIGNLTAYRRRAVQDDGRRRHVHVPYRGSDTAAMTELIAGRAQIYFGPVFSVIEQIRAGTCARWR